MLLHFRFLSLNAPDRKSSGEPVPAPTGSRATTSSSGDVVSANIKTKDVTYIQRNIVALARNRYYHQTVTSITHSECKLRRLLGYYAV
jgi:hypothetical protein